MIREEDINVKVKYEIPIFVVSTKIVLLYVIKKLHLIDKERANYKNIELNKKLIYLVNKEKHLID